MRLGEVVRNTLIAAPVAALVGGAVLYIGIDGPHALAIACGVLAIVLVLLAQRSALASPEADLTRTDPPIGGRRDLEQLAWSMTEQRTRVRPIVLDRVTAIAVHRLADHGIDPRRPQDAEAVEALIGSDAWAVLRPDRDRPVSPRALDATLRALERLPPPAPLASARPLPADRTSRAD